MRGQSRRSKLIKEAQHWGYVVNQVPVVDIGIKTMGSRMKDHVLAVSRVHRRFDGENVSAAVDRLQAVSAVNTTPYVKHTSKTSWLGLFIP